MHAYIFLVFSTAPWCSAPVSTRNIAAFDFWFAASEAPIVRRWSGGVVRLAQLRLVLHEHLRGLLPLLAQHRLMLHERVSTRCASFFASSASCSTRASPPVPPQPSRLHTRRTSQPLQLGGRSSEEGEHDRSREAKAQGLTVHGHPVAVPPFCLATSQPASVLVRKSGGAVGDSGCTNAGRGAMGRRGCGGMRQGRRGRDTGGRGCGGREQRDIMVTRVGAASWSGSGPRGGGGYEWVHLGRQCCDAR